MRRTIFIMMLLLLAGCHKRFYHVSKDVQNEHQQISSVSDRDIIYEILLVGDSGAPDTEKPDRIIQMLDEKLQKMGDNSAVVFLGDNIYPIGLPDTTKRRYNQAKNRIDVQLAALQYYNGNIFFIPGNHDWNDGKKRGWDYLKNQEQYIETRLDAGNTFIPDNGEPGPFVKPLTDSLVLVALDTQWWLQEHKKPEPISQQHIIDSLESVLETYKDKQVFIAGHHPLYSNGTHGGKLPPSTHLKPPVFGSLYVLYRKWFGLDQDISYKPYTKMQEKLTGVLQRYDNIVYASGHDHNLQYIPKRDDGKQQHYLVSGSASKQRYVKKGGQAEFVTDFRGFMKLTYYKNGPVELEAWIYKNDAEESVFKKIIYSKR